MRGHARVNKTTANAELGSAKGGTGGQPSVASASELASAPADCPPRGECFAALSSFNLSKPYAVCLMLLLEASPAESGTDAVRSGGEASSLA
jgi:hypothetical protein